MTRVRVLLGVALLLCAGSSGMAAEPQPDRRLMSPLMFVETLHGDVAMRSQGQNVFVTLRGDGGDHLFKVETDLLTGLPQLASTAGEIRFWRGHLVVIALREGKAWHFAIPSLDSLRNSEDPPLPGKELDAELRASYELTRLDKVIGIISRSGPGTLGGGASGPGSIFENETEYQDPGSGTGVGSCGRTCSTTCGDGSSCSANCVPNRCASCTCPATCTCK